MRKYLGSFPIFFSVEKYYVLSLLPISHFDKFQFQKLLGLEKIKRICILTVHDGFSPLPVFSLLLILDNHCEKFVRIQYIKAFPFVNVSPILLSVKPKSNVPHPDDSVYIQSLILDYCHPLSIIELIILFDDHLKSFSLDLEFCSVYSLASKSEIKSIQVLGLQHYVNWLIHLLYFHIQ